jgi:hypothetical protein
MDQINMLTVEKERLEMSFMTHQNHRSPRPLEHENRFVYTPRKVQNFPEELLLDSDEETVEKVVKTEISAKEIETQTEEMEEPIEKIEKGNELENVELISGSIETEVKSTVEVVVDSVDTVPKYKDAETQNEDLETPPRSPKEKRNGGPKRGHRRSNGVHGKRTKKSTLFPHAKVILQKVHNLSSEKLNQVALEQQVKKIFFN